MWVLISFFLSPELQNQVSLTIILSFHCIWLAVVGDLIASSRSPYGDIGGIYMVSPR